MTKEKKIDQNIDSTVQYNCKHLRATICESKVVKQQRKEIFQILMALRREGYTPQQLLYFIEGIVVEYTMIIYKGNHDNAAFHLGITRDMLRKKLKEPLIVSVQGVNDEIF